MHQAVGVREKAGQASRRGSINATGNGSVRPSHEGRSISGDTPDNNRCMVSDAWLLVVIQLGTCQWPAPLAIASGTCVKETGNHTCKPRRAAEH